MMTLKQLREFNPLPDPKEETKDAVQIAHSFLYDLGYKNINESYEVPTLS